MKKFLAIIACTLALNSFADRLKWDSSITMGELENGLKYYVKENSLPAKTANFYLVVDSGSVDERSNERGLAHFIEHMAFNGSRDFDKNDLIKTLESLGVSFGADLNAHTQYDETAYKLTVNVTDENLNKVFKIYNNWIDGVSFDTVELDKERGVIMAEERSRNTAGYRLFQQQAKDLFAGSAYLDKAPMGDMQIIKTVDRATIKALYDRIYQPRFMSFVAVGDFNATQIVSLIKSNFAAAKNTNDYVHPSKEIPFKSGLNIFNYDANETATNLVRITYVDAYTPRTDEKTARKILTDSYISNLIALLYEQKSTNENSLIRASFSRPTLQNQLVNYTFEAQVIGNDFNATLKDVLGVIKGIEQNGFNEKEFNDIKKSFVTSIKNRLKQSKTKKTGAYLNEIVGALKSGSTMQSERDSHDLSMKLLSEITPDEVNKEFKRILSLDDKRIGIFSSNGFRINKADFDTLYAQAKPYTGHLATEKLPDSLVDKSKLKAGKIASKSHDAAHDIWTYKLSNGATVMLKSIKTRKNSILFSAVSKGGTSNLARPKNGGFALSLSNESGAGAFNNYRIAKILSGKHISYKKTMGDLTHGFSGSATKDDIEHLFAAINLEFNAPRMDEQVLERMKKGLYDDLIKRESLPEYKFGKEFVEFYYENNERRAPLAKSDIDAIDIDELKKIIKNKFTNAAEYYFVIVGDFDEGSLDSLVEIYLASLPSREVKENYIDDGVRGKRGQHKFIRNYETSQKSEISVNIINEDVKYSQENSIKAQALNYVFKTALREQIREEEGETYGFSSVLALSKAPYARSALNLSFTASPNSVDKILSEIKQIRNEIRQKGALNPVHLENYKKSIILNIAKTKDQPDFWLKNIVSYVMFKNELFDETYYKNVVENISNDDIKAAAKLYFNDKNEIISINNPH